MTRYNIVLTISFAAGVLLSDQLHRLTLLSAPALSRRQLHQADLEFLPLELIQQAMQARSNETMTTDSVSKDETEKPVNLSRKFPWSLPFVPQIQKSSIEFMVEINDLKQSKNISLPWHTSSPLPLPIISFNLPKSATLTSKEYFACGGLAASHTYAPWSQIRIGDCMRDNFVSRRNPFQGCDYHSKLNRTIEFYSDIGIQHGQSGRGCWYSSINDGGLEHIAKYYPNATIFMVLRNPSSWYKSVTKWGGGRLLHGWKKRCGFSGSLGNHTQADWEDFYRAHTEKIRQFALKNLHMTYVEVELELTNAGEIMEYYTGIRASCLQHCYPGRPRDPNVNLKTYQKCKPVSLST
ncbi:hypothetical protein HJC23_007638 [Cyclotella cryptica]|uniref:Sulfotransferase n=1 Tax=Cyclotella cryptica TaxID=29204 RepID=A0ABD3QSL0_9STRA|eukprot:CCRYP_002947-RA/>CCRYP_002947-RA protein AED:0.28 eAED:0.22 QI:0/-1/0/1/-1/1/1/0/350